MKVFRTFRNCPNSKKLNLYHTLISAEGHQRLKTALPECEIVWDPDSALPNRRRS